ncbi:MAG: S-adenosylmethionine decarboxylase [Myxococcota bacterium]
MLGVHWLGHAQRCDPAVLSDPARLARFLADLASALELTVMAPPQVHVVPHGLAGVVLLGESHAAIHTDLTACSAYVDVFSCTTLDAATADRFVREALAARVLEWRVVQR